MNTLHIYTRQLPIKQRRILSERKMYWSQLYLCSSYKENRLVSMRNITILGDSIAVVLYIVRCDLVGGHVCSTDWSWLVEIRIYMYQMRMKKIYIYSFKDIAKVFVNGSDIYTHTRGKRLRTLSTLLTEDLICTFCAVICLPFGIIQSTLGDNTLNS